MRSNTKSDDGINSALNDSQRFPTDALSLRKAIIEAVAASPAKLTPRALENILSEKYRVSKRQIKPLIRELVAGGELIYTYLYGSSFLEPSFNKPVRVSARVVLKPPGIFYQPGPDDVVVEITPGAAFGCGRHPTTRLAIKGIEYALKRDGAVGPQQRQSVLDIGTGSGVLVISAVGCGMEQGLGIDIDPCARAEARNNINLNGLQQRIKISGRSVDCIGRRFGMIIANLRSPSLKKLVPRLIGMSLPAAVWVFSGIREHEAEGLKTLVSTKDFKCLWTETEQDWVAIVFRCVD